MIYPDNFEQKIGFDKIRELAGKYCLYQPGKDEIERLRFSSDPELIKKSLLEVEEFRQILIGAVEFPIENFIDISESLKKARLEGRFLEELEFFNLKKSLDSVRLILNFLKKDENAKFIAMQALAVDVKVFPVVIDRLNQVLNKIGRLKDSASRELQNIRKEIQLKESLISRKLNKILEKARKDGLVDEDATLAVRNGRSVIPVPSSNKRNVHGFIHDESATGKTSYIEPVEIVEANNELRELEAKEKREVIRILIELTDFIRPYIGDLKLSHIFLAKIDSIRARAKFALNIKAVHPKITNHPEIEWRNAIHPILLLSFRELGKEDRLVPLDIQLNKKDRILLISGPNAGGKSVCLQTVGLLQYMLQSGFLVPVNESSVFGIFESFFLDMGDEQSIEDDLSTYSSHLINMKIFSKNADQNSLILIDEFGSGTEPTLGAAISESILDHLNKSGAYGLITTHYTNLKHFASENEGLINAAMLYDTGLMKPLFKLVIGRPGSSFAFEIARKIGLSEEILKLAESKIGKEQVDYDKALRDLIRDKKYWENKRTKIRISEKRLEQLVERYDKELGDTEKLRKTILKEAKDKANALLNDANRKIENTIREIIEAEAEKEKTKAIRAGLNEFKTSVNEADFQDKNAVEAENLRNKIQEIKQRDKQIKAKNPQRKTESKQKPVNTPITQGDRVLMKGQDVPGQVLKVYAKKASVAFGHVKTTVLLEQLEKISPEDFQQNYPQKSRKADLGDWDVSRLRIKFSPDIDVRGKRAEEALQTINDFIDMAITVQTHDLRVLHGKGNGILRELIRQQLAASNVVESYRDEHVERGGAGVTIIKLIS
ncbi:MAG: Smr/MutS family protein [Bacteroidales bacterium]|nr:Smr/MutS family protein [Bacteroidales bacterium]MCF8390857.1 Smr/MutS family protein [Bacteroidales bacterium]